MTSQTQTSPKSLVQEWLHARPGEHFCIRIPASATGGAYSVTEVVSSPGDSTPIHVHANEDEILHVVEGTARVFYGEREFDAAPGTVVKLDRGIPHAFGNATNEPVRLLMTATPGGCEEALRLIATSVPDLDILEVARRFGVTVVGPPLVS